MTMRITIKNDETEENRTAEVQALDTYDGDETVAYTTILKPGESTEMYIHGTREVKIIEQ